MVFYIIGLGLSDETDITYKGLQAVKSCDIIYLEHYTSILGVQKEKLEEFYGKTITLADRETCEETIDEILKNCKANEDKNSAVLVVGDPFCATTHTDMFLRAVKIGLKVEVIHNASIMNAVACCGLQLYRFGETVTIPFFTENWRPYSFYEKIKKNRESNLHTLVLVDIKVKERTDENLFKNRKIYEPPRYMTCATAVEEMLEAEEKIGKGAYDKDTLGFGLSKVGSKEQKIVASKMEDFVERIEMGPPLHSFVICAPELHEIEQEMFNFYKF